MGRHSRSFRQARLSSRHGVEIFVFIERKRKSLLRAVALHRHEDGIPLSHVQHTVYHLIAAGDLFGFSADRDRFDDVALFENAVADGARGHVRHRVFLDDHRFAVFQHRFGIGELYGNPEHGAFDAAVIVENILHGVFYLRDRQSVSDIVHAVDGRSVRFQLIHALGIGDADELAPARRTARRPNFPS